jgi:PhnB protein
MMKITPYLTFNGRCEEAFKFYEKSLGGKIQMMMTYGEAPEGEKTPPESRNRIIHVTLTVGDQILQGSDAPPQYYSKPEGFSVSIGLEDPAEAERIFKALAENGTVKMPLQETFWAQRFGMVIDRFDIPWMVNCGK